MLKEWDCRPLYRKFPHGRQAVVEGQGTDVQIVLIRHASCLANYVNFPEFAVILGKQVLCKIR